MGHNSIRYNLTKQEIISDIKMTLAADFKNRMSVIVVEGLDDVDFFRGKTAEEVYIYESFSGKTGVKEITEFFDSHKVIGICDRDYDMAESCKNIFYYDFSCMEMMVISNDNAFKAFTDQIYQGELSHIELREKILYDIHWISCFRKLNALENWCIRLSGISIAKAYNNIRKCLELDKIISQINDANKNWLDENREILALISKEMKKPSDTLNLYDITQGHDFINCLHCNCNAAKKCTRKTLGVDAFSAALRVAYRTTDFIETTLYNNLLTYQITYKLHVLSK